MTERAKALSVLAANTVAFMVCFAVWMMYGVLVTFLVDRQLYAFSKVQMGWLIGIPVLTGSIFRLPAGMLTDRYGGRPVYAVVMLIAAACTYLVSYADRFWEFLLGGLGFGLAGTSFAVGIAYTSVWFPQRQQGTALGIFGAGNVGAALTALVAPRLLLAFTSGGAEPERWRLLPRVYAVALVAMTVLFWLATYSRKPQEAAVRSLGQRLSPLGSIRVWRFGLYYFFTFGMFVALSQWLIPYYVNVYALSVVAAGLFTSLFALPSGLLRAVGGWLSDRVGARAVMYSVLSGATAGFLLLTVPRMDVETIGEGVTAARPGTVTAVSESEVEVDGATYRLQTQRPFDPEREGGVWPVKRSWQDPVVQPGDQVPKRALLARGHTRIYFHANMAVFAGLVLVAGTLMGMGSGAVYKHVATYFPKDVGTVGGLVGVIGGLGGFVGPILFGYLLQWTGVWTTNWMFLAALSLTCLVWMHLVIRKMLRVRTAEIAGLIDERGTPIPIGLRVQCPVHAVEAQVRVFVTPTGETVRLGECSLWAREGVRAACEGRCVVLPATAAD